MLDPANDLAAARLDRFLTQEPVVWLSTVRPNGSPHLVPTWFAWDGQAITVLSKPGAQKVRNLRANASAMLALGDAVADFDVGLVEADATLEEPGAPVPDHYFEKYGERIAALGLTTGQFVATYPQVIRLVPRRALGWHGRSRPASVVAAARRVASSGPVSIDEAVAAGGRGGLRDWLGEPLARRVESLLLPRRIQRGVAI